MGEILERSFAYADDTRCLRGTHLRVHSSILKRLLVHASAFTLGLLRRQRCGHGTPRGLQGRGAAAWSRHIADLFRHTRRQRHMLLTAVRCPPTVWPSHSAWAIA